MGADPSPSSVFTLGNRRQGRCASLRDGLCPPLTPATKCERQPGRGSGPRSGSSLLVSRCPAGGLCCLRPVSSARFASPASWFVRSLTGWTVLAHFALPAARFVRSLRGSVRPDPVCVARVSARSSLTGWSVLTRFTLPAGGLCRLRLDRLRSLRVAGLVARLFLAASSCRLPSRLWLTTLCLPWSARRACSSEVA